ncbi:hypothetical protein BDR03DRAFT_1014865 [Suillus americanus]|nr:hypothetical protein BDR03DRAFT_1014865 [Suillus americanus]
MGRHRRNSSDNSANNDIDQANIVDEFAPNIPDQEPLVVEGGVEWGEAVKHCPNVLRVYAEGLMFMDVFNQDNYTHQRTEVPWYPFASQKDWEVAYWLMRTNLSMSEINEYLNLSFTKENSLSFHHAKELCQRVEMLPLGPHWKYEDIVTDCPMKRPLHIFYRDLINCLQSLLSNPQLADCINFDCRRFYDGQPFVVPPVSDPSGCISTWGDLVLGQNKGHQYICLANIASSTRAKALLHAYLLVALIPVPKFIHSNARAAAKMGIMMNDPIGNSRYCFMPLVSYVTDTPEELLVACVCINVSPVTTATREQFGDPFCHPIHKGSSTLAHIKAFFVACKKFNLNGVHEPFWLDWPLSDPSQFITPEALHHWHRMFWDHDLNWCIFVVSVDELYFCFMLSQVFVGYSGFKDGVSTLKQVSGRDHQDVQRYLIGLIAAAVPSDFLSAVRSLSKVKRALQGFHTLKEAIVNAVMQWSADPMERAHIDYVKVPGHARNNHDYDKQVCRYLDHQEKCQRFVLALEPKLGEGLDEEDEDDGNGDKAGGADHFKDYFEWAQQLIEGKHDAPRPFRTFATSITAYHLSADPTLTRMTVDKAAEKFVLHDLHAALADYLECDTAGSVHVIGGRRRAPSNCKLNFECIQPSQAVLAQPPSETLPCGRYDAVIVNVDLMFKWPHSHLEGHCVGYLRLIFRPITPLEHSGTYLAYVECLNVVTMDPAAGMHVLWHAQHSNGTHIGDVIPLSQIVSPAHLIPHFGQSVNP